MSKLWLTLFVLLPGSCLVMGGVLALRWLIRRRRSRRQRLTMIYLLRRQGARPVPVRRPPRCGPGARRGDCRFEADDLRVRRRGVKERRAELRSGGEAPPAAAASRGGPSPSAGAAGGPAAEQPDDGAAGALCPVAQSCGAVLCPAGPSGGRSRRGADAASRISRSVQPLRVRRAAGADVPPRGHSASRWPATPCCELPRRICAV